MDGAPQPEPWHHTYFNVATIPYWGVHVAAIAGVIVLGWSWTGVGIAIASYYARMFFVTAGLHRYFSHRSYKTSRVMQFVLALGAGTTVQKGALWWAAHHRRHHRYSDQAQDPHSPALRGFWWSHFGWILSRQFEPTHYDEIRDFAKYPELVWLNKLSVLPAIAFAVTLFLLGGATALVWGFFVSTVLLWNGTFTINSLSHVFGTQRYPTTDDSRNNFALAILTMGEGWHNNHHHYQRSTSQGFRWWEIDMTYYILKLLSVTRLVSGVSRPPSHIVAGETTAKRPARLDRAA